MVEGELESWKKTDNSHWLRPSGECDRLAEVQRGRGRGPLRRFFFVDEEEEEEEEEEVEFFFHRFRPSFVFLFLILQAFDFSRAFPSPSPHSISSFLLRTCRISAKNARPSGNRSSARAAVEPSDLDEEEADSDAGPLRRCCSFIIISALFPVAASRSFALFFWWEEERNGRRAPQGGTRELSSVK